MTSAPTLPGPLRDVGRPCGLWLGPSAGAELGFVCDCLRGRLELVECGTVADAVAWQAAGGRQPRLVLLAADRPGRWSLDAVVAAARQWPLATLLGVGTSLGEGRRRSGPVIAGLEEIAWHELPGRLECWLADLAAGRAGALAAPATARREERLLEALDSVMTVEQGDLRASVWLAGGRGADLEGLADLLALAGRRVAGTTSGRPPLDPPAPLVVWDAVAIGPDDLAWLRMVAANRPGVGIVLLESFPRGDSNQAALRAGAGAVLGRPLTLEALEGTLRRLERLDRETRGLTGLGAAAPRR
jgi:hypothetical protein